VSNFYSRRNPSATAPPPPSLPAEMLGPALARGELFCSPLSPPSHDVAQTLHHPAALQLAPFGWPRGTHLVYEGFFSSLTKVLKVKLQSCCSSCYNGVHTEGISRPAPTLLCRGHPAAEEALAVTSCRLRTWPRHTTSHCEAV